MCVCGVCGVFVSVCVSVRVVRVCEGVCVVRECVCCVCVSVSVCGVCVSVCVCVALFVQISTCIRCTVIPYCGYHSLRGLRSESAAFRAIGLQW